MKSAEKIAFMHDYFGKAEGYKCKDCMHLIKGHYHNLLLKKCEVYGMSHSVATDWNVTFDACGCFNKETDLEDLYKTRRHSPEKKDFALNGQMSILEVQDAQL